jgi:hypothetical protein
MSKAKMGARVAYCGHDGYFVADIFEIEGVNVVRANGKVSGDSIIRPADAATHHLSDFPGPGFWRPDLGVFVVPSDQVKELSATTNPKQARQKLRIKS